MLDHNWQTMNRRSWLKVVGTAGTAGLAGCIGGGNGGNSSGGNSGNSSGGNSGNSSGGNSGNSSGGNSGNSSGGNTVGNKKNNRWPDLNGHNLHFVTDETSAESKKFWNKTKRDFEQATGAETKMEYTSIGGVERITQLLQAGDPPEIFTMNAANAATFQTNDVLEPVDDVYDRIIDRIGEPNEQTQVKIDGKQWFIPLWTNAMCHYYRNDLSDIVPDTWDKATKYAKDVNSKKNMDGIYILAGTGDAMSYQLMAWMFSKKASLMKRKNGKITVAYNKGNNQKAMVEVLNYLKKIYQYSPTTTDADFTTWSEAIPNEVVGSTAYDGFRPPQLAAQAKKPFSTNIKAIPGMPKPNSGSHTTVASADGLATFKQSDTKAAEAFIEFIMREKYLIDIYMSLTPVHNNPVYSNIRNGKAYKQAISGLSNMWPRDSIDTYLNKVKFKVRSGDTDPPNPYSGPSYSSKPVWGLQQDVLVNDMGPKAAIEKWAPQHQDIIDEAQG